MYKKFFFFDMYKKFFLILCTKLWKLAEIFPNSLTGKNYLVKFPSGFIWHTNIFKILPITTKMKHHGSGSELTRSGSPKSISKFAPWKINLGIKPSRSLTSWKMLFFLTKHKGIPWKRQIYSKIKNRETNRSTLNEHNASHYKKIYLIENK